jgi:hypothetical protein
MQESCQCGSVRGAPGNRRPYRDTIRAEQRGIPCTTPQQKAKRTNRIAN